MKITDVRWTQAFIPIEAPLRYAFGSHPGFSRIVIEVETDEGITGLGECYGGPSRMGQLEELKPLLIGLDPMNLEKIRWKLGMPSSLKLFGYVLGFAGVEFALLDIQGKALNLAVCDLIGGRVRDEVPFAAYLFYRYPNEQGTGEVSNAEQMVAFAQELVAKYGFQSIKYKNGVLHPDEEVETFIALRKAFPKHRIRTGSQRRVDGDHRAGRRSQIARLQHGVFGRSGVGHAGHGASERQSPVGDASFQHVGLRIGGSISGGDG